MNLLALTDWVGYVAATNFITLLLAASILTMKLMIKPGRN